MKNALRVGYDVAKAALTGSDTHVNCRAGEHRTGSVVVTAHWFLSFSTLDVVLARILRENPGRADLLRYSLTYRRKAFNNASVLEAT